MCDSKFCNILIFSNFFGTDLVKFGNEAITLGELLSIWENEPDFQRPCECGTQGFIYHFGGHILSGTNYWHAWCPKCNKQFGGRDGNLGTLRTIRGKYRATGTPGYELAIFEELIDKIKEVNHGVYGNKYI
jgi:hypothetical protein